MTIPRVPTLREPEPRTTHDVAAAGLMTALQLLFMTGRIPKVDLAEVNQRLQREFGQFEPSALDLRLLFEGGLHLREITPYRLQDALDGRSGYTLWRENHFVSHLHAQRGLEGYDLWCQYARNELALRQKFASQNTLEVRAATLDDLRQLINEGWLVTMRDIRTNVRSIFYAYKDGAYHRYHPVYDRRAISPEDLRLFDTPSLRAWRRP